MSVPPMLMYLHVAKPGGTPVKLWLPLFLVWPLVLLVLALPLVLAFLLDIVLWLSGQRYHHYSLLLVRAFGLLAETRGMVVKVKDGDTTVEATVW